MDSQLLHNIAGFVCILSGLLLTIGLIRPFIVVWWGESKTRTKVLMVYGSILLISSVIYFTTINPKEDSLKRSGTEEQTAP
jgi:ABC-type Fe3+-siderophore transport system permease subunit